MKKRRINQMKQFFIELFEYNHQCNQKLVEVINDRPEKISEKAFKLYCHVLNAHHIWNGRIETKQTAFAVWEVHAVQALKSIDQINYEQTLQILDKLDLKEIFNYSNNKGITFGGSIRDILFHVINHSTYHRGQIATEFRQHGLEPLVTDYILLKR
jgi:uncharacterized damage-inducible protein DinB